jgi:hypothetical protein
MRQSLTVEETERIPDFVLAQYDASLKDPRLKGLLLFPEGENCKASNNTLRFCGRFLTKVL